jgi:hypothetical protein
VSTLMRLPKRALIRTVHPRPFTEGAHGNLPTERPGGKPCRRGELPKDPQQCTSRLLSAEMRAITQGNFRDVLTTL